jgi:formate hydrogenlyase transcriptional activator
MEEPLSVLIVDDSEDDAELVVRELKRGGFDVRHQRVDTAAAMDAATNASTWDLVVCDYSMPQFSGMDALGLQRSKDTDVPFIFLSGTIGEEAAITALKRGAHDCLNKSDLKRLIPTVRRELRDAAEREARRRLEREVRDLQKFAAIARLAGGIAHDLNNALGELLAAISSSAQGFVHHDCATLVFLDRFHDCMHLWVVDGDAEPMALASMPIAGHLETIPGLSGDEPIVLDELNDAGLPGAGLEHLSERMMRSGCAVPLLDGRQAVGALIFSSAKSGAFGQREAKALGDICAQIATSLNNALAFRQIADLTDRLRREKQYLQEELDREHHFQEIVGASSSLRHVLKEIETVAPTEATVLIQGETGTGKELLARSIHRLSPRRDRTFIKLNCASIPAGLLESELFGHEKGAFTGAIARKVGKLELANGGTLFLDEIGEMPQDLQPKLLRALQEREIERVGGSRPIPVDIRLIAATNRDLAKMVSQNQFRSDLFYRLKVFPVFSPPLRERAGDIPILVRHFVTVHSRRLGKRVDTIPQDAMEALTRWTWPGNIRELENFLERSVILTRGSVLYVPLSELRAEIPEENIESDTTSQLREVEREHILRVLKECKGQIGGPDGAAARLGMKRTTLNSRIAKLGIARSEYLRPTPAVV